MRFWIDTEFNSFEGALLSFAIVPEDSRSAPLYFVLHHHELQIHPWVRANVMPQIMDGAYTGFPVSRGMASRLLAAYLNAFDAAHIVADWPDDIRHFCDLLITGPGMRIDTPPLTLEIRRDLDGVPSANPHHALADAIALRASHLSLKD